VKVKERKKKYENVPEERMRALSERARIYS